MKYTDDYTAAMTATIQAAAEAIDVRHGVAYLDLSAILDGFRSPLAAELTDYAVKFCFHRGWDDVTADVMNPPAGFLKFERVSTAAERRASGACHYSEHSYAGIIGAERAKRIGW